jgi:hypothetical protein
MRVVVERREEVAGLTGRRKNYFADYLIQFSEEERAIIDARGLFDLYFRVRTPNPPRDPRFQRWLSILGPAALALSFPALIVGTVLKVISLTGALYMAGPAAALIFLAFCGFGAGFVWLYELLTRKGIEQHVTIGQIVERGRFTIWAHDPGDLKAIEIEAKGELQGMKQRILDCLEFTQRESFEV